MSIQAQATEILDKFNISHAHEGEVVRSFSPIDGQQIGAVEASAPRDIPAIAARSVTAFHAWRDVPAPLRGQFVRLLGERLRAAKADLGALVTIETGKILSEGLGEVQEMVDICDFAAGLSRQLYGLTMPSERPGHHMRETWQPLGPVAVISAFNFPAAVWSWNAALALACGDSLVWKPSEKTPLTAQACGALFRQAAADMETQYGVRVPQGLLQVVQGGRDVGEALVACRDIALVSATGSTAMGRRVAGIVAERLGRSLLELGGNNATIVTETADLEMAVRSILFGAVGTAGQRCTTLRRLIVHEKIYEDLAARLRKAYAAIRIGNPLSPETLVGPLIDADAAAAMERALAAAVKEGGKVLAGGGRAEIAGLNGHYVRPALVEMPGQAEIVRAETFAPILYLLKYRDFDTALALQNDVPQGLSSSIFSQDMRQVERFLSVSGSDCGIANVNMGTSGAEIGGAFGGEKETGGGRESGSDAWKSYMRRQTQTVNYSSQLPLAQGVSFDL